MTPTELTAGELTAALTRSADGLPTAEAAVRLLLEHSDWPQRLADADLIELDDEPGTDPSARFAWVSWRSAVAALDAGELYASSSDARVLRVAASLGGAVPVDLSDALTGLDRRTLSLVLAALSHANGSHQHLEYLTEPPADGGPATLTPTSPRLELGPLFGWPE